MGGGVKTSWITHESQYLILLFFYVHVLKKYVKWEIQGRGEAPDEYCFKTSFYKKTPGADMYILICFLFFYISALIFTLLCLKNFVLGPLIKSS